MDIVRDESVKKRKRRKQILVGIVAGIAILGITLGVSRLKPAPPGVDRGGKTAALPAADRKESE